MKLKPWYDVVKPREDLREGKPLDASEFAVHLDKVRLGNAPDDYKIPQRFFDRIYLTEHLTGMAAEVVRRLSGNTTETSAVFNMTASDFRGLKKIKDGIGKRFRAGVMLYDGEIAASFGEGMYSVPTSDLRAK